MSPRTPKTDEHDDIQPGSDSWGEWAHHIFAEIKRLDSISDKNRDDFQKLSLDVAVLKVKSGLWGAAAGAISVIVLLAVSYLSGVVEKKHETIQPTQTAEHYNVPPGYQLTPIPTTQPSPQQPAQPPAKTSP